MKYFIFAFIFAMCITCVFGGSRSAKSYVGAGVNNVRVSDGDPMSAQVEESMIGEMNFVDMDREHMGTTTIKDIKRGSHPDFPHLGRFI